VLTSFKKKEAKMAVTNATKPEKKHGRKYG
jgi:hypothetical protein